MTVSQEMTHLLTVEIWNLNPWNRWIEVKQGTKAKSGKKSKRLKQQKQYHLTMPLRGW